MKLRFTPRAIAHVEDIADYIREKSPNSARRVRADIYDSQQMLLLFPHVGRRQTTPGVRKFLTRRYGYLAYYTIHETREEVGILSIRHPARRRDHQDA